MKVLAPGSRGAEGKEKGKGIVARRDLEEARSKSAGRRTGTGYEVWYARGQRARDLEALHPPWGGFERRPEWTESIAVGSESFLRAIKERLGIRAKGRKWWEGRAGLN